MQELKNHLVVNEGLCVEFLDQSIHRVVRKVHGHVLF